MGRDHLGDLSTDKKTILQQILKKHGAQVWTGFIWLRTGFNQRLLMNKVMNLKGP
jgi:hypothetical protein